MFKVLTVALTLSVGFIGCNLFNPTESADVASDDPDALTYEGYIHFRKGEYTIASDYFKQAIHADSSHSSAWYAWAKCIMNQQNINVFEMLKYAKSSGSALSGFLQMSDDEAIKYKNGIDSVLFVLDQLIAREKAGKTDNAVPFRVYSASYSILQLTKTGIAMRKTQSSINNMFSTENGFGINFSQLNLDTLVDDVKEIIHTTKEALIALQENPDQMSTVLDDLAPEFKLLSDTGKVVAVGFVADQLSFMDQQVSSTDNAGRESVFFTVGNHIDDDGDGCVDEELPDKIDNDGDGEIDEDLRSNDIYNMGDPNTVIAYQKTGYPPFKISDSYKLVDINGDGEPGNAEEWEINPDRIFKFATALTWTVRATDPSSKEEHIRIKEAIRLDNDINNIQYDLDARKAMLGGCWNNYDYNRFLMWFEGRK